MKRAVFLALMAAAAVSGNAATVRTATEDYVDSKIADAAGSSTNYTDAAVGDLAVDVTNRLAGVDSALRELIAEKANNSDVVHTSGAETIGGEKTFTGNMTVPFINTGQGAITVGLSGRIWQATAGGLVDDRVLPNYGEVKSDLVGKQDNLPYPTNAIPYAAISGKPTIPTVPTAQINAATTTNALQDAQLSTLSTNIYTKADKSALSAAAQAATNYTDAAVSAESARAEAAALAAYNSATNYAYGIAVDEYIEGTWTAATTNWTGRSRAYSLRDGHHVRIRLPYAGAANVTLNLTLADGSTTGALPVYFQGSTGRLSTQYGAGSIVGMTYRGGVWRTDGDYDTNTNYFDRNKVLYCKARSAIAVNKLAVGTADGYVEVRTNVSFDISYPILYVNGAQTAGKTNGDNWYSSFPGINLATTWAGWAGDANTRGRTVYLVGSYDRSTRMFTVDQDCPFSLDFRAPCFVLGHYNAGANTSFYFHPGPLVEEDSASAPTGFVACTNGLARPANGAAAYLTITDGGVLFAESATWPDGASVLAVVRPMGGYTVSPEIAMIGYGTWPTNAYQMVAWRVGPVVCCNIISEFSSAPAVAYGADGAAAARSPVGWTYLAGPIEYQANGNAVDLTIASGGTFAASATGWIDGQSLMVSVHPAGAYSVASNVSLVGYGSWPDGDFTAVIWRVGANFYVNIIRR